MITKVAHRSRHVLNRVCSGFAFDIRLIANRCETAVLPTVAFFDFILCGHAGLSQLL